MRKILRPLFVTLSVLFVFGAFLPVINISHAQATTLSATTTIIPPSFELFANPGDTLKEKIKVRNETAFPIDYSISNEDFQADGDTGAVDLVKTEANKTYSLSSWINVDSNQISVPAHSEQDITFEINVPNGAEPGGHYGAVTIESVPGNTPGAANVAVKQASLILLRVSGNVTEKASAVSFTAPKYSEYGPIPLTLLVKNTGDVHINPQGTVIITDIFGAKVDEFPLNGANVLPGAERLMLTNWTNKNPIGRFTATVVATYGESRQPLTATTTFTVFPKPLAIGIGIAAGCIVLLALIAFAGRKRISKALKVIAQG